MGVLSAGNVLLDMAITTATGFAGVLLAVVLRRRTTLSIRNLYAPAAVGMLAFAAAAIARAWTVEMIVLPLAAPWVAGGISGRRWRIADLGAGDELRAHERARRWAWQPAPARSPGERKYLRSQGELVHERPWPARIPFVPMTAAGAGGARLPLGQGQHVFGVGATGAGKTTSARRLCAARTLTQHAALFILDQKSDPGDIAQMRRLAAKAGVPFILFDPEDASSDRWQPLWGTPAKVAARAVEPIKESEPYYYDMLCLHLDVVCRVLHAADRWPPSIPLLIDTCDPLQYPAILAIADGLDAKHAVLKRRCKRHARYVNSPKGIEDLTGGAFRLEVALGLGGREMVTPRLTPGGEAVGVRLIEAMRQRAVVMWCTHADTMPKQAAAVSVLALADLHDAAEQGDAPWTLLLDEFGAVIKMAAERGVAILQRGRSHHGQVIVITQSVADIEALSQLPGLLASLTDNFTAVIAHRQTSPEARDWLAKMMGTRGLWQHTNQTTSHGQAHSGQGSARRVREFRVGADVFATLADGEAVIYNVHGPDPARAAILPVALTDQEPERIGTGARHECEVLVHPEETLPAVALAGEQAPPSSHSDPRAV